MTTKTKRQAVRPGDLAYVIGAGFGEIPLYRIVSFDTDGDGTVSTYYLAATSDASNRGAPVAAERVVGVFKNILTQE